jgi:putative toxin-antitoxin system antitoxin component (TIGR02293 family)
MEGNRGFAVSTAPRPRANRTAQPHRAPAAASPVDLKAYGEVLQRAASVIGDRQDAMRWLGTPVAALNFATPISLLHSADGRNEVLAVLGRIEHGVL